MDVRPLLAVRRSGGTGRSVNRRRDVGVAAYMVAFDLRRGGAQLYIEIEIDQRLEIPAFAPVATLR